MRCACRSAPKRPTGWWSRRSASSWGAGRDGHAAVRPARAHRRRLDRIVDRAWRAPARARANHRGDRPHARDAQARGIVSDAGSVKSAVVRDMAPHLPAHAYFVPAHPVAGTEHSGPDSGFAELFINRWCILTPPPGTDPKAVERLAAFWRALGANVETMTPEHHDLVLAITSHVPHLIAYTIVGTADELGDVTESEVLQFSAGGFRDFTRIAASDPTMWRDVFLANKDAVLEMLGAFQEDLSKLTRAIRRGDGEALFDHFTRTRAIRRGIVSIGQDSAAPDFGRPHASLPQT